MTYSMLYYALKFLISNDFLKCFLSAFCAFNRINKLSLTINHSLCYINYVWNHTWFKLLSSAAIASCNSVYFCSNSSAVIAAAGSFPAIFKRFEKLSKRENFHKNFGAVYEIVKNERLKLSRNMRARATKSEFMTQCQNNQTTVIKDARTNPSYFQKFNWKFRLYAYTRLNKLI